MSRDLGPKVLGSQTRDEEAKCDWYAQHILNGAPGEEEDQLNQPWRNNGVELQGGANVRSS